MKGYLYSSPCDALEAAFTDAIICTPSITTTAMPAIAPITIKIASVIVRTIPIELMDPSRDNPRKKKKRLAYKYALKQTLKFIASLQ